MAITIITEEAAAPDPKPERRVVRAAPVRGVVQESEGDALARYLADLRAKRAAYMREYRKKHPKKGEKR